MRGVAGGLNHIRLVLRQHERKPFGAPMKNDAPRQIDAMDAGRGTVTTIAVIVGCYWIANVALVIYASAQSPPFPFFELMKVLAGLSFAGALLMVPTYFYFRRRGFRILDAL